MDVEINKALKILFKDAGFETEKTVAKFDEANFAVNIYFKKDTCRKGLGCLDIIRCLKANGLLAAELINKKYYCAFTDFLQIFLPLSFGFEIKARLSGKPHRRGA